MANFWHYLLFASGGFLLPACGPPDQPAQAPPPAPAPLPTVVATARHYASLLARAAPLATPARRQYAGRQPSSQSAAAADSSYSVCLSWRLPNYEVQAFLDRQQRPATVRLLVPHPPEDPHRQVAEPWHAPGRLVRLGELRRAFGPGKMGQFRVLRQYEFAYQPVPTGPLLTIRAFLPTEQPVDSTMVEQVVISKAAPNEGAPEK